MKGTLSIFAVLMLVLTAVPFVLAQDTNTTAPTSNWTIQNDVAIMSTVNGIQLRLLQLQDSIQKAVAEGQIVINKLSTNGTDVSALQSDLNSLQALEQNVSQVDPTSTDAISQFMAIRQQAMELVRDFKTKADQIIKADQKADILQRIKNLQEQDRDLQQRIEKLRQNINADIFAQTMSGLNLQVPGLVEQLRNGAINVTEARENLKDAYEKISAKNKEDAQTKLQEIISQLRVKQLANLEKLQNATNRGMMWAQNNNRTMMYQHLGNISQRVGNRIGKFQNNGYGMPNATGGQQ